MVSHIIYAQWIFHLSQKNSLHSRCFDVEVELSGKQSIKCGISLFYKTKAGHFNWLFTSNTTNVKKTEYIARVAWVHLNVLFSMKMWMKIEMIWYPNTYQHVGCNKLWLWSIFGIRIEWKWVDTLEKKCIFRILVWYMKLKKNEWINQINWIWKSMKKYYYWLKNLYCLMHRLQIDATFSCSMIRRQVFSIIKIFLFTFNLQVFSSKHLCFLLANLFFLS